VGRIGLKNLQEDIGQFLNNGLVMIVNLRRVHEMNKMVIPIDKFVLLLLDKNPMRIPSVRFWAMALILTSAGIKIQMKDGHILTKEDCFIEMDDCASGDCYRLDTRGNIIAYLYQKRVYFGW